MVTLSDESSSASNDEQQYGQVFVLHHEEFEASSLCVLFAHIQDTFNVPSLVCLGPHSTTIPNSHSVLTPSEYCIRLFRKFHLHANEQEVLLGAEDQMIATQLCIAELNKKITGDFDVQVSKVLEFQKRLQAVKLKPDNVAEADEANELDDALTRDTVCSGSDVDFDSFYHQYADFLKSNNNVDLMDVINRLQKEIRVNEELQKVIQRDSLLLLDTPKDKLESTLISLITTGKTIHWVRLEESLMNDDGQALIEREQIKFEVTELGCVLNRMPAGVFPGTTKTSATEHYVENLILGYIHLLVNTRSEIALARVINVPQRGIDHKAFTDIKHMAQNKQLSMYQTVTSFVLKSRFRVQDKTSCASSKLSQHIKGLSEFTNLMYKLQTILEEDPDTRSAVRRVLGVIKRTIVNCHDNTIRQSSVELVESHLQDYATWVMNEMQTVINDSPERSVSAGGSLIGRQSLRVLRCILDHAATQPPVSSVLDTLTDVDSSQKTPLKFPSIMSQFRSPVEGRPEAAESKSLVQRVKERCFVRKAANVPCKSSLDWAKPEHDAEINQHKECQLTADCHMTCKTIVHPGTSFKKQNHQEAMMDKENIGSMLPQKMFTDDSKTNPVDDQIQMNHEKLTSSKRRLNDAGNKQDQKRLKVASSTVRQEKKAKTSRKKLIPLQKGQKTLNAFFRL